MGRINETLGRLQVEVALSPPRARPRRSHRIPCPPAPLGGPAPPASLVVRVLGIPRDGRRVRGACRQRRHQNRGEAGLFFAKVPLGGLSALKKHPSLLSIAQEQVAAPLVLQARAASGVDLVRKFRAAKEYAEGTFNMPATA